MASRDEVNLISDSDEEDVGVASPASTTFSSALSASPASQLPRFSPQSATSTTSSTSSDPRRIPARSNPTTLPPAAPRRQVQRLNDEQQARRFDDERKESPDERNQPQVSAPHIPHFPLNTAKSSQPPSNVPPSPSSAAPSLPPLSDATGSSVVNKMEFVPRPEAVTHADDYKAAESKGLPAVAYALCEYIDNALTALRRSMQREPRMQPEIRILFVEPTGQYAQKKKMYILIRSVHRTAHHANTTLPLTVTVPYSTRPFFPIALHSHCTTSCYLTLHCHAHHIFFF